MTEEIKRRRKLVKKLHKTGSIIGMRMKVGIIKGGKLHSEGRWVAPNIIRTQIWAFRSCNYLTKCKRQGVWPGWRVQSMVRSLGKANGGLLTKALKRGKVYRITPPGLGMFHLLLASWLDKVEALSFTPSALQTIITISRLPANRVTTNIKIITIAL